MENLSHETIRLLDRLFNLKGEDNVIIRGIEEKIKNNKDLIDAENEAQKKNEVDKLNCEGKLSVFEAQRDAFESVFGDLDDNTFSALRDIGVSIEIGTMLKKIKADSPKYCSDLSEQIENYQKAIAKNIDKKANLSKELTDLESSKETSIQNRDKLISLLEQSLSTDEVERESLSTSYVKKILALFDVFTADEVGILTKLIIFPDDGLFEYNDSYDERLRSGKINLDGEPTDDSDEVTLDGQEDKKDEDKKAEDKKDSSSEHSVEDSKRKPMTSLEEDLLKVLGTFNDLDAGVEEEPSKDDKAGEATSSDDVKDDTHQEDEERKETSLDNAEEHPADDKSSDDKRDEATQSLAEEPKTEEVYGETSKDDELGKTSLFNLDSLNGLNATASQPQEDDKDKEEDKPKQDEVSLGESEPPKESDSTPAPEAAEPEEPKIELISGVNPQETTKDDGTEEYLNNIGLNITDFIKFNNMMNKKDIVACFEGVNHKLIEDNYELLRSLNVSAKAIYTCLEVNGSLYFYLTDSDLSKKITLLRAKGISETVIKELIENQKSGLAQSLTTLQDRIAAIESIRGQVSNENISLIGSNVVKLKNNCQELTKAGLELEGQEIRNNQGLLMASDYVREDLNVLKNYLISLVRKNGKYALTPFMKKPYELMTDIDDLIEADLDGILETEIEVLGQNVSEVLKRVRYCETKGLPVFEGNDRTSFCDYIGNYSKFFFEYGNPENIAVPSLDENNKQLPSIIGNDSYIEILTNILDEYYRDNKDVVEVKLDSDVVNDFESLQHLLVEKFGAVSASKYSFKIGDIRVSKNKFERQLSIILNALASSGQQINGVEREILLTALLYNTRHDEESLRKVAGMGLGFNKSLVLGGNK